MRQHALEAFGKIPTEILERCKPELTRRLSFGTPNVRKAAIYAIGALQPETIVEWKVHLLERLHDPEKAIQQAALEVLSKSPPAALADLRLHLLPLLHGSCPDIQRTITCLLKKLSPQDLLLWKPDLLSRLEHDQDFHVLRDLLTLFQLLPPSELAGMGPLLCKLCVIRGICGLPGSNTQSDSNAAFVNSNALKLIGMLPPSELVASISPILSALDSAYADVTQMASTILSKLPSKELVLLKPQLVERLESCDSISSSTSLAWQKRQRTVALLGKLSPEDLVTWWKFELAQRLEDVNKFVRIAAIAALKQVPPKLLLEWEPQIKAGLEDADEDVQGHMVGLLGNLQPPDAIAEWAPGLVANLERRATRVQCKIFEVLMKLPPQHLNDYTSDIQQYLLEAGAHDSSLAHIKMAILTGMRKLPLVVLCDWKTVLTAAMEQNECPFFQNTCIGLLEMMESGKNEIDQMDGINEQQKSAFAQRLEDVNKFVRIAAIEDLKRVPPKLLLEWEPQIKAGLEDADEDVQGHMVGLLGNLQPPDAIAEWAPGLVANLERRATRVQCKIFEVLMKLPPQHLNDYTSDIQQYLLEAGDADDESLVKMAILTGMRKLPLVVLCEWKTVLTAAMEQNESKQIQNICKELLEMMESGNNGIGDSGTQQDADRVEGRDRGGEQIKNDPAAAAVAEKRVQETMVAAVPEANTVDKIPELETGAIATASQVEAVDTDYQEQFKAPPTGDWPT